MTAYSAVADGRLTNEEVGALDRRWMGVRKRLDDRAIPVRWVMSELQRIAPPESKRPIRVKSEYGWVEKIPLPEKSG